MRALAHPVRIALLEALRRDGPLTATRAAELLDDSPGNMSWHLQTLAKYGFVEEAGGGRGRSRPWRAVSLTLSVKGAPQGRGVCLLKMLLKRACRRPPTNAYASGGQDADRSRRIGSRRRFRPSASRT